MKKYRVIKQYPKQIMNSSRMVTLTPGDIIYLKYEASLERLINLGYIIEIHEIKKRHIEKPKIVEDKPIIQPKKPKAKYQQEVALEDKTGESNGY
jgi:hypothetical protein